jgi:hypothetical protein
VIATRPEIAEETIRECAELGIRHVWMHPSFGAGSVSKAATNYGRQQGIAVIDGGSRITSLSHACRTARADGGRNRQA